ncbi:glutamate-1-semialdehyde 2,1-aminomutase 2, chloroplastic-like [Raphanus sativus]|uniref:Glutamate-1-semialdehyde 2,1-aminomutase 2, chloroplastic-like n=1 Tax=Raphanus sativus TaxID=3726 RepID=A0A9W3C4S1_RAPSA|nr:glutamate-1-semialdehyde 2,1-aminomutase 2, chloroplastic-like [Raphanus sativus]XP_056846494.1 glutamate-1-semialdehyde 2,1-aminomutase 2, chloroplastic-like [Raphanus sativus]
MSATLTGSGTALGFSCSSKISKRVSSSPSTRCSVKMSVSVDEKKKSFTLQKSKEAFNAAKVSEADNSLPLDIHNQVFQLVEKGNDAFKESRFEEVREMRKLIRTSKIILRSRRKSWLKLRKRHHLQRR